ncbi:uncharacterized protein HaLaN_12052, partial [Haematococcus lacustris]
ALLTGDAKWGSALAVGGAFAAEAIMVTHDNQEFIGRTAIIRRLNAGMEQFLKMLGVEAVDVEGGEGAGEGASDLSTPANQAGGQAALVQQKEAAGRKQLLEQLAARAGQ